MTRISDLPRRTWSEETTPAELIAGVSAIFEKPGAEMHLQCMQALALLELAETGSLFANIPVGGGKTLIFALCPVIFGSKRPLGLVPGTLKGKTRKDLERYAKHFRVPNNLRVESYEKLSRAPKIHPDTPEDDRSREGWLETYDPDLIVCDEAYALKNLERAACARKLNRFKKKHPACKIIILGGTLTKDSILDYAHQIVWSHGEGAPMPLDPDLQKLWAQCLDPKVEFRPDLAPLVPHLGHFTCLDGARELYQKRLSETPGVIIGTRGYEDSSLVYEGHANIDPALEDAFCALRTQSVAPDGYPLADYKYAVWGVAREIGVGGHYYHDPRPPDDWLAARKTWCADCRRFLETSQDIDSEFQVCDEIVHGRLPHLKASYDAWVAVRDKYDPEKHKMWAWLSTHTLEACERWGRKGPGIIWVEHVAFGEELSRRTGWKYFGSEGLAADKTYIEDASGTIIASVAANFFGRNLQYNWHRNLVVCPMPSSVTWEQLVGRTHRQGQPSDLVTVDYFISCKEDLGSVYNARTEADGNYALTHQRQKLTFGDHVDATLPGKLGYAFRNK